MGSTVACDPRHRGVIAYNGIRYFRVGGVVTATEFGSDTWANGKKGNGLAGTWVDAEDGVLCRNPIEQGSGDCTVGFDFGACAAVESRPGTHWLCLDARLSHFPTHDPTSIISTLPPRTQR